jgi:S1-C subfamily serine protease
LEVGLFKQEVSMDNRLVKVFGGLVAVGLVLLVGAVVGGALIYGLIRLGPLPVVQAQAGDPGYGVVIAHVEPESPAADAGVVRGDILLEIDGEALDQSLGLDPRLGEYQPGDEVELTVLHGDEQRTLTAVLGERRDIPYLGISPCTVRSTAVWLDRLTAGAVITEVLPDSPAEEAGLTVGDVILAIGSQRMDAGAELADVMAGYEPGNSVVLEIEGEEGEPRKVSVNLGEHPEDEDLAYLGVRYSTRRGIRHFDWTIPPIVEEEHLEPFTMPFSMPHGVTVEGLVVLHVTEDSPASDAGLVAGDTIRAVDGKEVASREELGETIADFKPGDMISLTVGRIGTTEEGEVDVILGEDPDEEGKPYLGVTLWPAPHLGPIEGEGPHFWRHEGFGFDEFPFFSEGMVQGAIVLSVEEGSPASAASLGKGDVITAVDGDPLVEPEGLVDLISGLEPGDKLALTVIEGDGDAEREIEVTLGEHPDEKGKAYLGVEIGSYRRVERRGTYEGPRRFGLGGERFRFGLPLDELPFHLDEIPRWFNYHWTPGEDDCEGAGCSDDSA